jgi:hypothetical protein
MEKFTNDDLAALVQKDDFPSISLYMTIDQAGPAKRQNPIRYKTLLKSVEQQLLDLGLRMEDTQALLDPARRLVDDISLWRHLESGLVIFISPTVFRYYQVPLALREHALVGDRFYLLPLFPLVNYDGQFYVLALSREAARLLRCDRQSVIKVHPSKMPKSLVDILQYYEREKQLQFHTRSNQFQRTRGGERQAMIYGHGTGTEEYKEKIGEYFQQVSRELTEYLAGTQAPLVLAGSAANQGIFREVSRYPYLMENGIDNNPDHIEDEALHRQAWPIVAPHFSRRLEMARTLYGNATGTGLSSDNLHDIIPAADNGQIAELLVNDSVHQWGVYNASEPEVLLHQDPQPGDQELLNLAASLAYLNGGTVQIDDMLPLDTPAAAILRY